MRQYMVGLESLSGVDWNKHEMPVLFVGHGNPMYAITDNPYRRSWALLGTLVPRPKAVLCISAHWLTQGTFVCTTERPETIHDFYGFPDALYRETYPVTGAPEYARRLKSLVKRISIQTDDARGLDHGAWSVLKNMFPNADIPVFQMSLDYDRPEIHHYELAKQIAFLRKEGVLVLCSGNLVHNLSRVKWEDQAPAYDWALAFDNYVRENIEVSHHGNLMEHRKTGTVSQLAHPTTDHYLPLMYVLGLRDTDDELIFFNDVIDMGSVGMRSIIIF